MVITMQKILIIDDDDAIREMLTVLLEEENIPVTGCGSGQDALRILEVYRFSAIVVDIFLPDFNGIDFIKTIQNKNITTPIIIITGSSQFELVRQAIRLGVYDYLIKPFKNAQFLQIIRNAIQQDELNQEKLNLENDKKQYQQELEQQVKESIAQIRESESRYKSLVEQSLMGVYILQDGLFQFVNRKLCEILDISSDQILNKTGLLDFTADDHKSLVDTHLRRIARGEVMAESFRFHALTTKNELRVLEVWSGLIEFQGANAIEGIVLDITEHHFTKIRERQLELELLNEHKLAAIGQLATGISHNLNTPISIIQANAELLRLKKADTPEIEKILNQTKRMAELINIILIKGKKDQSTEYTQININELLRQELEFLNANLYYKHHIEKDFHFAESVPGFEAVYSDFSQSIMHIIQNAIDAMYKAPQRKLTITTQVENSTIIVTIADTGKGIPAKLLPKIFDPFFTTKPVNVDEEKDIHQPRGTGLGLSLVYNLLTPYKVKIDVKSEENHGTVFTLRIPTLK